MTRTGPLHHGRLVLPHLTSPYKGEEKGWRPARPLCIHDYG